MALHTGIEWASHSWNPYTWNCNKVSPGCKHCYAATLAERYGKTFNGAPQWRENAAAELRRMKPGDVLFVNSMSDTYHEGVPVEWVRRIFGYARQYPDLIFLVLTKRIERAAAMASVMTYPANVWHGTSVESASYLWRLDHLRKIPGGRFVSFEPLLGSVAGVDLRGIEWAIVGGESGADRRPFDVDWAREIRQACRVSGSAFFFKQGGAFKSGQHRILDGRTWDETPFKPYEVIDVPLVRAVQQLSLFG